MVHLVEEGAAPLPGTVGATAEEVTALGGSGIGAEIGSGLIA